jgi:hypothetical protein
MQDVTPRRRQSVDWRLALLADSIGRVDSLAAVLAARVIETRDDELDACIALAERIQRDLDRLLVELVEVMFVVRAA